MAAALGMQWKGPERAKLGDEELIRAMDKLEQRLKEKASPHAKRLKRFVAVGAMGNSPGEHGESLGRLYLDGAAEKARHGEAAKRRKTGDRADRTGEPEGRGAERGRSKRKKTRKERRRRHSDSAESSDSSDSGSESSDGDGSESSGAARKKKKKRRSRGRSKSSRSSRSSKAPDSESGGDELAVTTLKTLTPIGVH